MNDKPQGPTATDLIHHAYEPPAGFAAVTTGIYKASTVIFPNVAAMRTRQWKDKSGYTYGLHGTPSTFVLEERLATLEGGSHVVLAPSGLCALALVNMALLTAGDHLLLPDNVYGPNKEFVHQELRRWGVSASMYDPQDASSLGAQIRPQTKMIWLEAAGSVSLEFPDLVGLIQVARAHGLIVALDNTWGAGLAFAPFAIAAGSGQTVAVDVSVHALTKYPSGGADVMMGSVTTQDAALHERLQASHMRLGLGVGANDVELLLRSLPTLHLRYAAQDAAARLLATWFQSQPQIAQVLHPALPGSPGHEYWSNICAAAAGIFSVVFQPQYTQAQIDAFVDALRLFKIGYSWGGPVSLVMPYQVRAMRELPCAYQGRLVRLCVGLERVQDLQADCLQAMSRHCP